jgi:hypothetical protein
MTTTPETQEGMYLSKLDPGSVLDVQTSHRHYRIEFLGGEEVRISGHPSYCPARRRRRAISKRASWAAACT